MSVTYDYVLHPIPRNIPEHQQKIVFFISSHCKTFICSYCTRYIGEIEEILILRWKLLFHIYVS